MSTDALPADLLEPLAERVIQSAYLGILGREPDPDGLAHHSARLRQEGQLATVLSDIAGSEEAWRRSLAARGPDLVGAVFRALLGREPEEEARTAYAELLSRTGDVEALLLEIAQSREHESRVLARHGLAAGTAQTPSAGAMANHDATVDAVFRGLLGRAPDADALAAYTRLLGETGDLAAFIAEVGRSAEHRRRVLLGRP